MKISIITATYNSQEFIRSNIESVNSQTIRNDIEHIIIDGRSTDNTLDIIDEYKDQFSYFISEKDNGIYEALNKGIAKAQGEYIGVLHSDDLFSNSRALENVQEYLTMSNPECLLSDVSIVNRNNISKVKRHYSAKNFSLGHLRFGIMPPHPGIFIRRRLFDNFGMYSTDFKIAADFEFVVRLLWKHQVPFCYLPKVTTLMRDGGISNRGFSRSKRLITSEILKACKENELNTGRFLLNIRYLMKIGQILH